MTGTAISAEQRAFLETTLRSFEKLELLHAVRTSGRAVSRAELAVASRLDATVVAAMLVELEQATLVELDSRSELVTLGVLARDHVCESLLALYQADRTVVLSTLSSIAVKRIRSMTARAFADAFVLRKKRGDQDG